MKPEWIVFAGQLLRSAKDDGMYYGIPITNFWPALWTAEERRELAEAMVRDKTGRTELNHDDLETIRVCVEHSPAAWWLREFLGKQLEKTFALNRTLA